MKNLPNVPGSIRLVDAASRELVLEATEARSIAQRMRGLVGAPAPPPGRGMIMRAKQVHTFGMKHPIDAVYMGADGRVLRVASLAPRRLGPLVAKARWVLEIGRGEAARLGIEEGRRLELVKERR